MTNLRRHASSRISGSRRKSENSIGGFLSHGDPGERKSATPHSVEIPAPVNATASRVESTSDWSLALPSSTEATITSRLPQVWFDHPPLSPGLRPSGMTRTFLAHRTRRLAGCGGAYFDYLRLVRVGAKTIFVSARRREERRTEEQRCCCKSEGERQFRQAAAPMQADAQRWLQAHGARFE